MLVVCVWVEVFPGGLVPWVGWAVGGAAMSGLARRVQARLLRTNGPDGPLGRSLPTGTIAFWTTLMLAAFLLIGAV